MADKIVLGSGKLYVIDFTDTIPEDTAVETENNILGSYHILPLLQPFCAPQFQRPRKGFYIPNRVRS